MNHGIQMLEEVIELARNEFNLMELEDADGLIESASKRDNLLQKAWQEKNGCDEAEFVDLLMSVQDLQRKLAATAEEKLEETRNALNGQKKSRKAALDYCKTGAEYSGKKPPRMVTKRS